MNDTSYKLVLENTNYVNAIGLDAPKHYSSARDLLKLILAVRTYNKLNIVMGSRYYTLRELKNGRQTTVANTNDMLFKLPGTVGFKTGTTDNAGECIVYGYTNGDVNLIIIVMGSKNRFYDTASLLDIYLSQFGSLNKPIINEATKIYQPAITTPTTLSSF
jgi:D-alanyl-D-alanine carboxypeptidase (penicillin-binding protein 5/6)